MKKILFATTALVATAGVASADVALSGSAKMGIVGGDAYADQTQFFTDIDVTFTMSGEADNGLTFGASIDLDESDGDPSAAFGGTTQGGETIFVSFGGAKLTMGDVDGAFDAAMQEVGFGGSIADAHTSHVGFSGNSGFDGTYDGQIAQFAYSFDSFTAYISAEMDDSGDSDPVWGIGAKYSADLGGTTLNIGLGYQTADDNGSIELFDGGDDEDAAIIIADYDSLMGISVGAALSSGVEVALNYSQYSGSDTLEDTTHIGLGLGYSMNQLTVGVNYGQWESDGDSVSGFGLAVDYDLGGGLVAQAGYGVSQFDIDGIDADDQNVFSLGLSMSF